MKSCLTIAALGDQILSARRTAKPIVGIILKPDHWADLRKDRTAILHFAHIREGQTQTLAGVPLHVDWRQGAQTVAFTDRAAMADALSRATVKAA